MLSEWFTSPRVSIEKAAIRSVDTPLAAILRKIQPNLRNQKITYSTKMRGKKSIPQPFLYISDIPTLGDANSEPDA